jgi:hypothetical protein
LQNVFRVIPRPGAGDIEISQGGDSGAIWVDENSGKGIGLHFAGEIGGNPEQALAHALPQVLQYLNVQLPLQNIPPFPPPEEEPVAEPIIVEEPKSFWQRFWQWLHNLFQ